MAKYKSKYKSLGFYVEDKRYKFVNGEFTTDDKKIIAVLDGLIDAQPVKQPEAQSKTKPKASAK